MLTTVAHQPVVDHVSTPLALVVAGVTAVLLVCWVLIKLKRLVFRLLGLAGAFGASTGIHFGVQDLIHQIFTATHT